MQRLLWVPLGVQVVSGGDTQPARPEPADQVPKAPRPPFDGAGFDERQEMAEEQAKMRERGERLPG